MCVPFVSPDPKNYFKKCVTSPLQGLAVPPPKSLKKGHWSSGPIEVGRWSAQCGSAPYGKKNDQLGWVEYSHSSSCSQNWKKDIGAVTRHSYFCNWGYVLHPAVFDGTIHSLGTASVGKNVNDLKIFGGVGRVSIIQSENFSQHEPWLRSLHHCMTDQVEWAIEFNRMNYLSKYFLWFSCMCC